MNPLLGAVDSLATHLATAPLPAAAAAIPRDDTVGECLRFSLVLAQLEVQLPISLDELALGVTFQLDETPL